jgi:hypothetical protein
MLGAQGLWAGRDLYCATPAVTRDLGFSGLIRRTAPFSSLLRHTRGCGGSILTRILTGLNNEISRKRNLLTSKSPGIKAMCFSFRHLNLIKETYFIMFLYLGKYLETQEDHPINVADFGTCEGKTILPFLKLLIGKFYNFILTLDKHRFKHCKGYFKTRHYCLYKTCTIICP